MRSIGLCMPIRRNCARWRNSLIRVSPQERFTCPIPMCLRRYTRREFSRSSVIASGKEKLAAARNARMTVDYGYFAQPFSFDRLQQIVVVNGAIGRLLTACLLGGLVGLDREVNRKAAGVRTNLLICMGAAFFTLLSAVLAGDASPNKGQVASNIVQGIGFLGAGVILHNRSRVSGLTSAASIWVVASIGMACGAGLYAAAVVAALIVIVALQLVGLVEQRASLKGYPLVYEARGRDQ